MKGWEAELPTTFPIERLHRDAVRDAHRRRTRRRRRYQGATAGVCALLAIAAGVLAANRDAPTEQVQAGPGPTGATSALAKANGKIAFIRTTGPGDPAPKIYVMDEDGSGQTMMTAETTRGASLAWSPDGTRLAFDDADGIYTVNADGSGATRVPTTSNPDMWPAWSPDGTKLAVRIFDAQARTGAIDIVNVDGSGRRRVVVGDPAHPAWSPDGSRIAYESAGRLYVVNTDGSGRRKLGTGGFDEPVWSPDGRQIAFRRNDTISVINVDGGAVRQLATHGGTTLPPGGEGAKPVAGRGTPDTPQWSPDGKKIVYSLTQSAQSCSIWIMNANGSGQSPLTDGRTCDRGPAWQPKVS